MLCIIKSGSGYFIKFDNGSPLMSSDLNNATRFIIEQALEIKDKLEKQGYGVEILKRDPWDCKIITNEFTEIAKNLFIRVHQNTANKQNKEEK